MINYRVDDLESFVQRLVRRKVKVDPIHTVLTLRGLANSPHLKEPEGNRTLATFYRNLGIYRLKKKKSGKLCQHKRRLTVESLGRVWT